MSSFFIGIVCSLIAPLFITFGLVVWEQRWSGHAIALNIFKGLLASLMYLSLLVILYLTDSDAEISPPSLQDRKRKPWSPDINGSVWGWLLLSGLIGITIGDNLWLGALQLIGARRVILVDSLKPFLASFFGYAFMDEEAVTRWGFVVGLCVTMTGIVITALEVDRAGRGWRREEQEGAEEVVGAAAGDDNDPLAVEKRCAKNKTDSVVELDDICLATASRDGVSRSRNKSPGSEESPRPLDDDQKIAGSPLGPSRPRDDVKETEEDIKARYTRGYICAFVNVIFDVYGATLVKLHCKQLNTLEVNFVRFGGAGVTLGLLATVYRCCFRPGESMWQDRRGDVAGSSDARTIEPPAWYRAPVLSRSDWIWVSGTVVLVTFSAPALAVYGLFSMPIGLNMTLTSTGPLWTIPVVYLMRDESVSRVGRVAAVLAVVGIVFLCLAVSR